LTGLNFGGRPRGDRKQTLMHRKCTENAQKRSEYVIPIASIKPVRSTSITVKQEQIYGVLIAFIIFTTWIISILLLLSIDISKLPTFGVIFALLWQTFLYTGLFITAHDAMHGVVFPKNLKLNHLIGSVAIFCYAFFSYRDLLKKHRLHHLYPGSERDPDFHNFKHENCLAWYLLFMRRYWNWGQWISLMLAFNFMSRILHLPEANLTLFWVIPPILSSVQLFYFGTFLTHRRPKAGYTNAHHAQSTSLPVFLSFFTCYYFGYHEEHHEHPHAPWWRLPALRDGQIS
jgi:beta-carotene ketolase (CrtW type)